MKLTAAKNLFMNVNSAHIKESTVIINYEGTNSIGFETLIDTQKYIYLNNHVFGGKCFVPAAFIMEIFLEAALWLYSTIYNQNNFYPVELQNLNIERAIAIPPGNSTKICILLKGLIEFDDKIVMEIFISSDRASQTGNVIGKLRNASCNVILKKPRTAPSKISLPEVDFVDYYIPQDKYYNLYFPNLGPSFQTATARFSVSTNFEYLLGEYDCAGKETAFILGERGDFLSSPLGNDSCLQYVGFLSRILAVVGRVPIGGKQINFYHSQPKSGKLQVLVRCLDIGENTMSCDIVSFDKELRPFFYAEDFLVRSSPYHRNIGQEEFNRYLDEFKILCPRPGSW